MLAHLCLVETVELLPGLWILLLLLLRLLHAHHALLHPHHTHRERCEWHIEIWLLHISLHVHVYVFFN